MSTSPPPSRRAEVERLFDGLVAFGRSVRSRSNEWAHEGTDLSHNDIAALGIIDLRGTCRPGTIADLLNVGPSVISRQLAALQRLGLLHREPDPGDGRAELVSLTGDGRTRLTQARAAICGSLAERLADWDLDRIGTAADVLDDLSTLLVGSAPLHPTEEPHA